MLVQWSKTAAEDIHEIMHYIRADNTTAAQKLYATLIDVADKLAFMPYMGRKGRVLGTREFLAHPNYPSARKTLSFRVGI